MNDTGLHYLTYDEEELWKAMQLVYIAEGGDLLYPGDEKEVILRGVQQILMLAFSGIDNALRMDTLRYAVRDYLDLYGEKRNCYRITAQPAKTTVTITTNATGLSDTIPKGSQMTQDGTLFFALDEAISLTGLQETIVASVTATTAGTIGNALEEGAEMTLASGHSGVFSIIANADATGGQDEEDDETYRERIRTYGLAAVTTGPEDQYERAAKEASSDVIDAAALNGGSGKVDVYLLPASGATTSTLIAEVEAALRAEDVRPLNDLVTVAIATKKEYTLNMQYKVADGTNVSAALAEAVNEYKAWQEKTIGRAFNPDKLKAMMYSAGCSLVVIGSGSEFDGGTAEYTEIDADEYCEGTITLAVIDDD